MALPAQIIRPRRLAAEGAVKPHHREGTYKLALPVKLYFLTVAFPIHFYAGPLFMTGLRALLIVMMIPMCINLLSGKYGRIILTDVLFFLFSVWVIATLFVNSPASALSFGGSVVVEFFGGYMLARAYIRSAQDMAAMIRALFFLVMFTIPFALYEGQTGKAFIPELIRNFPIIGSVKDFYNELAGRRLGLERVQVIFDHPIHYGLFCSTIFSLMFIGFKGVFSDLQRYLASALIAFATFLSLSSGAILPILLQTGFIVWAAALRPVKSKWLILVGIIALCYGVIDALSNRSPIDVFMSYATFSPSNAYWRKSIFEWGMKNVWANPILGIGLNNWFRPPWMYISSVDNFWLLSAMRYGIPGLLLLAIGVFKPIWNITWCKIDQNSLAWQFRRAWVITFIGMTLTLSTVDVWATMFAHVAFLLGSGIWFITTTPQTAATTAATPALLRQAPIAYTRFAPKKATD